MSTDSYLDCNRQLDEGYIRYPHQTPRSWKWLNITKTVGILTPTPHISVPSVMAQLVIYSSRAQGVVLTTPETAKLSRKRLSYPPKPYVFLFIGSGPSNGMKVMCSMDGPDPTQAKSTKIFWKQSRSPPLNHMHSYSFCQAA